ncbi:MAG: stage IV sporulation protein A [Oscillospiraceae bacterium]|nr:stage IV sporulation protein A [Oscillospiraceae bacterium]
MTNTSIYQDISVRCGGDIYVGIVGPVRTGKSTFIKKMMETLVMPNIENVFDKERARDELPQSASGRTVMTTEPKFIPDEAVSITVDENVSLRVKLIDCVGYIVPEALGHIEEGQPRMVNTPWQAEPMPFVEAAEYGTRKVIADHSTIGLLVTCDGSVCEIDREHYVEAEERVAREMKELNKPFAIVLNSRNPNNSDTVALAYSLEEKYGVPVALVNCLDVDSEDIRHILGMILNEFPVKEIRVNLPQWTRALEPAHWLMQSVGGSVMEGALGVGKMGDIKEMFADSPESEHITDLAVRNLDMGTGRVTIDVALDGRLYYRVMSELTGLEITSEQQLITLMRDLAETKKKYDKVEEALRTVEENGYGIVMPNIRDLRLEEPQIVKQPGGYGVKLKASAPSIHFESIKQKYRIWTKKRSA